MDRRAGGRHNQTYKYMHEEEDCCHHSLVFKRAVTGVLLIHQLKKLPVWIRHFFLCQQSPLLCCPQLYNGVR